MGAVAFGRSFADAVGFGAFGEFVAPAGFCGESGQILMGYSHWSEQWVYKRETFFKQ